MVFQGWLIKFGNTVLPNKYLRQYDETPNQRLELDAYRDVAALLHRETAASYKTAMTIPIRQLYLGEKITLKAIVDSAIINERERKVAVTYWNSEDMDYKTGEFYMPDIKYTITHVDEQGLNMVYKEFDIQLIEY